MAKAAIVRKNGRREESRGSNNNPVDDVVDGAKRICELLLKEDLFDDNAQTGQGQNISRAACEDQTAQRTRGARRRRSSSPLRTPEPSKKSKNALKDDGSRSYQDDRNRRQTKSERDGRSVEKTSRSGAPILTLCVGRRAPLAKPEDSTVTPEAEPDVYKKMGLLRFQSITTDPDSHDEAGDDEADHESNPDDEGYDDVDGDPGADDLSNGGSSDVAAAETVDERDKVLTEIALRLRNIGDIENSRIPAGEMTRSASTVSLSMMAIDGIQDLFSNLTYEKFQDVVNRNMGSEPGVQQVTVMFRLARAVARFGNGTQVAVKGIALDYFRKNVATWVAENGGWAGFAECLRSRHD